MYWVAICDNDLSICGEMETFIMDYGKVYGLNIETEVFSTGEELSHAMKETEKCFDLLFLNIELPEMNGVEVGLWIREDQKNERNFTTGKTEVTPTQPNE